MSHLSSWRADIICRLLRCANDDVIDIIDIKKKYFMRLAGDEQVI